MFDKQIINPEFTRNIWTEFSISRIILMPVVLAFIYTIVYLNIDAWDSPHEVMRNWTYWLNGILLFLWGTKIVSESVIAEINQRTWISQKMTPISAGQMTFGKLFGSTIYIWYGVTLNTIVFFLFVWNYQDITKELNYFLVFMLTAIFIHALTLIISLLVIEKQKNHKTKIRTTLFFILSIIASVTIVSYSYTGFNVTEETAITWFGIQTNAQQVILFTTIFFTTWAIVGAYSTMRRELQIPFQRYNWPIFIISTAVFFTGFLTNIEDTQLNEKIIIAIYILAIFSAIMAYFTVFTEQKGRLVYKMFLNKIKQKKYLSEYVPMWAIALFFTLISLVLVQIYTLIVWKEISALNDQKNMIFPITLLLFIIRDFSLIIYNSLQAKSARADLTTIMYFIILYFLFPTIIGTVGNESWMVIFIPKPDENMLFANIPILIQAGLISWLLFSQISKDKNTL